MRNNFKNHFENQNSVNCIKSAFVTLKIRKNSFFEQPYINIMLK